MHPLLTSEDVDREINQWLLDGTFENGSEAERHWLDHHHDDLVRLVKELDGDAFDRHEAIRMLISHGSRAWEDELCW